MEINIKELQEVIASRGGRKTPRFTLSKGGYFNVNNAYKEQNDIKNKNSINMKAIRKADKLIVAISFHEKEEDGSFKLTLNGKSKSSWFSGRSLFSQFGLDFKELVPKGKTIKLKPNIQNSEGVRYFIIEISIPKK